MSTHDESTHHDDSPTERPEPVRAVPRPTRWFDKYDRAALYFLVLGLPVLAAFGTGLPVVYGWLANNELIAARTGDVYFLDATVDQVDSSDQAFASATIWIQNPSIIQVVTALIVPGLIVLLAAVAAWLIIGLSDEVEAGYSFRAANVKRLRGLGIVIITAGAVYSFVSPIVTTYLMSSVTYTGDIDVRGDNGLFLLSAVAGVLVGGLFGQAFSVGGDLADEASEAI